jgi:hypothetical protein
VTKSDTNPTPKKRRDTKETQRLFLEAYSQHANVMLSARVAKVNRSTIYEWLEHDQDFSFAYNQAKEDAKDTLRAEIYRRGVEGWDEAVYQLAKFAGDVRKYDTTLLIFHAKMMMSEYRDKPPVDPSSQTSERELQKLQDAIAEALRPYPEIQARVSDALAEKGL